MIPYEENCAQAPRKAYQSPELTVYGPIVGLTQNNKQRGRFDNGGRTRQS